MSEFSTAQTKRFTQIFDAIADGQPEINLEVSGVGRHGAKWLVWWWWRAGNESNPRRGFQKLFRSGEHLTARQGMVDCGLVVGGYRWRGLDRQR